MIVQIAEVQLWVLAAIDRNFQKAIAKGLIFHTIGKTMPHVAEEISHRGIQEHAKRALQSGELIRTADMSQLHESSYGSCGNYHERADRGNRGPQFQRHGHLDLPAQNGLAKRVGGCANPWNLGHSAFAPRIFQGHPIRLMESSGSAISWDAITAIGTVFTGLAIVVTAIAGVDQLRQLRAQRRDAAAVDLLRSLQDESFSRALWLILTGSDSDPHLQGGRIAGGFPL